MSLVSVHNDIITKSCAHVGTGTFFYQFHNVSTTLGLLQKYTSLVNNVCMNQTGLLIENFWAKTHEQFTTFF